MKKRIFIFAAGAVLAAIFFSSCEKMEMESVSYASDEAFVKAKAVAKDTTTTKKPETPVDTTSSRSAQPDTTIVPPVAPKDTLLPTYYGEPVEMGISLVAADTTGKVKPHNGKGKMFEFKAMCVTFENGALVVVFEKDRTLPTIEEVKAAKFIKGEFSGYNSGYDPDENGIWLPAIAKDESFGIEYTANNKKVRSILNKTLDTWGWTNRDKNGNYSSLVDGYSYSVEDGKMTIRFGNESLILY